MSRQISFVMPNSGAITAVANNKSHTIQKDHPNYDKLKQAIRDDDVDTFERLVDIPKTLTTCLNKNGVNKVTVDGGQVFYNGEVLHNTVTDRILAFMADDLPFQPLVAFLENLMENMSFNSREQLYGFLEHMGLPITDDGCFLAYKRVNSDWKDFHSGTIDYSIGSVVTLDRSKVDDNPNNHCSSGIHAGALGYVEGFHTGEGRVIIVKINPKDCVSVPNDHQAMKLRTCKLEVVGEYTGLLEAPLYHTNGGVSEWDVDDDWDDDEDGITDTDLEDDWDDDEFEDEDDDDIDW